MHNLPVASRVKNGPMPEPLVTATTGAIVVEPLTVEHADAVLRICQAGLDGSLASFETAAPDWPAFDQAHLRDHRFVARADNTILGWAACSPVSARSAYRGVVEDSVYVDPAAAGRGVGRRLLTALLTSTDAAGIWTVQAAVFPENVASLALHAAVGFRTVGTRERIAMHHGQWRDVILIERRCP